MVFLTKRGKSSELHELLESSSIIHVRGLQHLRVIFLLLLPFLKRCYYCFCINPATFNWIIMPRSNQLHKMRTGCLPHNAPKIYLPLNMPQIIKSLHSHSTGDFAVTTPCNYRSPVELCTRIGSRQVAGKKEGIAVSITLL